MATPIDPELARAALRGLDDEDRKALRTGVSLDRAKLIETKLVRSAHRVNRRGETKFCGRRTPLGLACAKILQEEHGLSIEELIARAIARTDLAISRHGAASEAAKLAQSDVDWLYIDLAEKEDRETHGDEAWQEMNPDG